MEKIQEKSVVLPGKTHEVSLIETLKATKLFLVALSIVLVVFGALVLALPAQAQAASLYFSPSSGSYTIDESFTVGIYVSSTDQAMNAASGIISFPKDKLEVISLSKSDSLVTLWVKEPSFSNSAGTVTFEGIVLNPGFTGSDGKIITINFKVKAIGNESLIFRDGSVLANDGLGTNVLSSLGGATYTLNPTDVAPPIIQPPVEQPSVPGTVPPRVAVSSFTHPNQDRWYSNNAPEFSWGIPSGTTVMSYTIDRKPDTNPSFGTRNLISTKRFSDLEEGIWYFHINFKNQLGWGSLTHRKVLIDLTPPQPFEIEVDNLGDSTNPQPILKFETSDEISGLDYYEVYVDSGDAHIISSEETNPSYTLPLQIPGTHAIVVRAVDKAGNLTQASIEIIIKSIEAPIIIYADYELFLGDKLFVRGSGIPGSKINLHLQGEGKEEEVRTDVATVHAKGEWSFTTDSFFTPGDYSFYVIQEDERGVRSEPSKTVNFIVQAFLKIGPWKISGFYIFLILAILLISSVAGFTLLLIKIQSIRKRVRREARDAKKKLHWTVDGMKEEITEKLRELKSEKGRRGLSKKEIALEKKLKGDLDIMEKYIRKEIDDITPKLSRIPGIYNYKSSWVSRFIIRIKMIFTERT